MDIFIICRTQASTRTIINLYKTHPDTFKYTEGFEILDNSITQYLNNLDDGHQDAKFKANINNPYDSGDTEGFLESCYEDGNCMVIQFEFNNGQFIKWSWCKAVYDRLDIENLFYYNSFNFIQLVRKYSENLSEQILIDNKLKEIDELKATKEIFDLDVRKINDFIKIETTLIKISLINGVTYYEDNSCLTVFLNNGSTINFDTDTYTEQELTNAFENICKTLNCD